MMDIPVHEVPAHEAQCKALQLSGSSVPSDHTDDTPQLGPLDTVIYEGLG